jgi:hypothetical protein
MHSFDGAHAARACLPKNGEAETTGGSLGLWDQTKSLAGDDTGASLSRQAYPVRLERVTRRLAELGFGLYPLYDEQLLVTNEWAMSRTLPSIEAAERFCRQIGGAPR